VIPLPWNPVYQQAWTAFQASLNARYGSNPALVAAAISGPICASDEMILLTAVNTTAPQPSRLAPDDMWAALIQHSFPTNAAYQKSDQVFIDPWKQAIDAAESIFTDVTLFIGRIAALPRGGHSIGQQACQERPAAAKIRRPTKAPPAISPTGGRQGCYGREDDRCLRR
jgi:hypothetical protein